MSANLLKQAFLSDLSKNLFPDNAFYQNAKDDSAFVDNNQVNLPHAGAKPGVKVDRETKGVASKRADSASKYPLVELSTDPTWLQYSEELLVAYNKRASILEEHIETLNEGAADYIAAAWVKNLTSGDLIRTTGTERPVNGVAGATGNRKRLTLDDLLKIQTKMDSDNIPQEGRFAVITPSFKEDMLRIPEVKSSDFNKVKPLVSGSIGEFLGITFYVRSRVNVYTTGGTLREYGSETTAATDCAGAIFWQRDKVRKAKGASKVFVNVDDAELYGSKMSALTRFGGIAARKDKKGVYALVEDNAS